MRMHTLEQVSRLTGLSMWELKRRRRDGTLPGIPIGTGTQRQHIRLTDEQCRQLLASAAESEQAQPAELDPRAAARLEAVRATRDAHRKHPGRRAA